MVSWGELLTASQPMLICWAVSYYKASSASSFTFCFVAVWWSQKEAAVCFCGHARCFCGFHTVDIKPSHLWGTKCPARVSVARLVGSSDFYHQQAHYYIFDHVHWLFTSGSFSCCFSFLIWYYLWALRWGGKAYLSPQCSFSPRDVSWLASAQQFWNTFTAEKNPSKCEEKH